jgi:hypothetical protein
LWIAAKVVLTGPLDIKANEMIQIKNVDEEAIIEVLRKYASREMQIRLWLSTGESV